MRRAHADPVDGVLVLDKPLGISSNLALQKARGLLNARKAGHTGTLDPLAGGLLPLTFGEATKFSADLLDADKEYEAGIALGATTASGDAEGPVLVQRPVQCDRERFEAALAAFRGTIAQVPPMHSALKHEGRPLYELARRGREVERAPRTVRIERLELVHWDPLRPVVTIRCSKGTYVRVLAQDLGEALGCGAHLFGLRRTAVGPLRLAQAVTLEALAALAPGERRACLLPVDALVAGLPEVALDGAAAGRFAHGQAVAMQGECERLRVYGPHRRLLGVAAVGGGWLRATRLVAHSDAAPAPHAGAGDTEFQEVQTREAR